MKNIEKTLLTILAIIALTSCAANRRLPAPEGTVSPLSGSTDFKENSLVYALPMTVVDISIEAERTVEKPGPYAQYAEDMLGLRDVIKSDAVHWEIKDIIISTHQELDPSEFYIVSAGSMFLTNVLSMKKEGIIMDLNPETYYSGKPVSQVINNENAKTAAFDLGADEYFKTKNDTVYKLLNVDTAFIRVPYLVEKKQKISIDQLAEKAANRLMELRDGKHSILTGDANVFPQSDAAIKEINRMEKEYTELFTGKTIKEKRHFTYEIIPKKEMAGRKNILCGFSKIAGPVASSGKFEIPVTIEFLSENKTQSLETIGKKVQESAKKYDRMIYRVPEVTSIRVSYGNEIINTSRQLIYQFGEKTELPANYIIGK